MNNKHIWEGWTVQNFIDDLEPNFDRIVSNAREFRIEKFTESGELKKWCMSNQPYYKKHIPEVYKYFKDKLDKLNKNINL
jgi:hypothetical protein